MFVFIGATIHPIYVSVTEIQHNAKDKTLEISCKIFTGDFENILKSKTTSKINLLQPADKKLMEYLVNQYIQQHLKIKVDGKLKTMEFLGYEQNEDAIQSYFEIDDVATLKKIDIQDDILYEYKSEQISIIHVVVNGNRKSTKLVNPESSVSLNY
jgi:predicted alpha/beta-fold hydrolase